MLPLVGPLLLSYLYLIYHSFTDSEDVNPYGGAVCIFMVTNLTLLADVDPSMYDISYIHCIWLFSHWLAISNTGVNTIIYF